MVAWPSGQKPSFFSLEEVGVQVEIRRGYFQVFSSFIVFLPFGFLLLILTADPVSFARFSRKRISSLFYKAGELLRGKSSGSSKLSFPCLNFGSRFVMS